MINARFKSTNLLPDQAAVSPHPLEQTDAASVVAPVPSAALLRGQKSVAIEHQGAVYRLQLTKLGKLILTK